MKSEPLANKSDTDRAIEAGQKRVEAGQKEEMGQRAGPVKRKMGPSSRGRPRTRQLLSSC